MTKPSKQVVAVVDDDPGALDSLANLLEAAGYAVRLYSSAIMVWLRGGLADIDLLISDIGMPEMDGFALRRLALARRPGLPVILISGHPAMQAPASAIVERERYFEKPFDGQRLLAAVRAALTPSGPKPAEASD
jgi:DNA-binding NtrC family response regulator